MAAITNYHKLGSLNHRNMSSYSLGGQKPEIKVFAGLSPSEGSGREIIPGFPPSFCWLLAILGVLWLEMYHPNLCLHLDITFFSA